MRHNLRTTSVVHPLDLAVALAEDDIEDQPDDNNDSEGSKVEREDEDNDELEQEENTKEEQAALEIYG